MAATTRYGPTRYGPTHCDLAATAALLRLPCYDPTATTRPPRSDRYDRVVDQVASGFGR